MTNFHRYELGIPTKQSVDYDKIYVFKASEHKLSEMFTRYEYNRGSMDSERIKLHIAKIANALMSPGGCRAMLPIVVDINTLIIADGNCRFSAALDCIANGNNDIFIKVIFEDIPEGKLDERVIELNTTSQSWTTLNFIKNFALRGLGSYKEFLEYCYSNPMLIGKNGAINPRYAIASLGLYSEKLKDPNLVISKETFEFGRMVLRFASDIVEILQKEYRSCTIKLEGFLGSISYLLKEVDDEIDYEIFIAELKKTVSSRKREVAVPIGSEKKREWNNFFNSIYNYYSKTMRKKQKEGKETQKREGIAGMPGCVGVGSVSVEDFEEAAVEPEYIREIS